MSDNLTKEQKEAILQYQGGEFVDYQSTKLAMNFPEAAKVIRLFHLTPARKSIRWDYDLYPNFDAYAQNTGTDDSGVLETNHETHELSGMKYSAVIWKYRNEVATILAILKQIETSDVDAIIEEYKTANGLNEPADQN